MADAPLRGDGPDAAEVRLNRLLNMILEAAVEALGFDAATVTARHRGDLATVAATDQRLVALDDAQYDSGEGPCLAVLEPHEPISLDDAGEVGDRWEYFSRTAAHLGVHSTLSMHLPVDSADVAASLNMYSKQRLELGDEQVAAAAPFAEQLAAAIVSVDAYRSTARLARDMADAMRSRAVIEQAKGMLMADQRIDADQAFQRLTQLSQRSNMKLRDIAQRIVTERTDPPNPA
ncbi:MAG TPA: GAF and ANTAR domain-containing protein [Gaiellales bacterium]|nr:GAF and ANTAR domain-containing protein [Gaiellales bacterium]